VDDITDYIMESCWRVRRSRNSLQRDAKLIVASLALLEKAGGRGSGEQQAGLGETAT